jgi:LPS sulfotransferase NodH
MMQDPQMGVVQPEQDSTPEERDRRHEEAARELEDLKQAWLRAYQAQGIDPKTVNYDALLLEDTEDNAEDPD